MRSLVLRQCIATNKEVLQLNGRYLSNVFQRPIELISNPTQGPFADIFECIMGRTFDFVSESAEIRPGTNLHHALEPREGPRHALGPLTGRHRKEENPPSFHTPGRRPEPSLRVLAMPPRPSSGFVLRVFARLSFRGGHDLRTYSRTRCVICQLPPASLYFT